MKRTAILISVSVAGVAGIAIALIAFLFWSPLAEAYGPMSQVDSRCLICSRERITKVLCGRVVRDDINENGHSEWLDSFTPIDHEHLWSGGTGYYRHNWFGRTSIACGGISVMSQIFALRSSLGESAAQHLAVRFQNIVRGSWPRLDWQEVERFEKALAANPSSLLEGADPN